MLLPTASLLLAVTALEPPAELEKNVAAFFEENCTACHDAGSDEIDLESSPARLVDIKSNVTGKPMVVPGDVEGSYLWAKLKGTGIEGDPMPLGDDPFSDDKLAPVRAWIEGLAPAGGAGGDGGSDAGTTSSGGTAAAAVDLAPYEKAVADKQAAAESAEKTVQEFFNDNCTVCHDSGSQEVNLVAPLGRLTGESSKYTQKPFIVPGDLEGSYLWAKVKGKDIEGDPMPQGERPFPDDQLAPIKNWIMALGEVEKAKADLEAAKNGGGEGPVDNKTPGETPVDKPEQPAECKRRKKDGTCKPDKPISDPPFHGTFQVNLPTTAGLGKRRFEFRIDHRFGQIGTKRGAFGLDAGAVMSVGFAYGIIDGLDVLLRRSNSRKGYELGVKYIPVMQEYGMPLSFGAYTSIEYYRDFDTNTANPVSGNFQLLLSRLWFERWSTMLVVGYYLRTNHAANVTADFGDGNGRVAATDTRNTLNLGFASSVWLGKKKRWGIDLEYIFPIPADVFFWNGANDSPSTVNIGSWSLGGSWHSPSKKHFFQIMFTNTREIHTNLYAPGGQTRNPFENRGNFFIGFNLSRKWSF